MILYLGDSFTWGQGLEFEYLIDNGILSEGDTKHFMPNLFNLEKFPLHLHDYREKHRYSRLVSEHFKLGCVVGKYGNGGSNENIQFILQNLKKYLTSPSGIELLVIQTTHPSRSGIQNVLSTEDLFKKETELFSASIKRVESLYGFKVITLSWIREMGDYLLNELGDEKVVSFDYRGDVYNSFEPFLGAISLTNKYHGCNDGHFSSEGHQFIANSIIEHIEKYNLLQPIDYFKKYII